MTTTIRPLSGTVSTWDVLEWVKDRFRENHLRVNMSRVLWKEGLDSLIPSRPRVVPDCGTVGCVWGWCIEGLGTHFTYMTAVESALFPDSSICSARLFYPSTDAGCLLNWERPPAGMNVQSREYRDLVIKHIEQFQERHEQVLKSTKVDVDAFRRQHPDPPVSKRSQA